MDQTIFIDPVPKPRMTRRDRWLKRPSVVTYYDYCNKLKAEIGVYPKGWKGQVAIEFVIPVPKSVSKKESSRRIHTCHTIKPDIDNLIKGVLDAIFEDDSGIHMITATKEWGEKGCVHISMQEWS